MSGSKARLGIFGGTFDPIHIGHLIAAEEAMARLALDQVLFIPTGRPWMKEGRAISPGRHRLAMLRLAVASNPRFLTSDVELRRPGPTYTVDTLRQLRQKYGPDAELYLVLGMDSLREIDRWHRPDLIFQMCTVVGVTRPGADASLPEWPGDLRRWAAERLVLLDGPAIGVSGSDIRRRVAAGLPIKYMVPEAVEEYIRRHRLYAQGG